MKVLEPRLEEIALVYSAYQDWLQKKTGRITRDAAGWRRLRSNQNLGLGRDTRLLVVSGFDEFNPTQLGVFSLLANRAKKPHHVDRRYSEPKPIAHHRFHRAQNALTSSLAIQPEMMDSASLLSSALRKWKRLLFENFESSRSAPETNGRNQNFGSCNRVHRSPNPRPEARAVLRWVKARVVRDGMKLSEVAVCARNLEPYLPFLEEIAAEFGIPLRIVGGQPLIETLPSPAFISTCYHFLPMTFLVRARFEDSWRSSIF